MKIVLRDANGVFLEEVEGEYSVDPGIQAGDYITYGGEHRRVREKIWSPNTRLMTYRLDCVFGPTIGGSELINLS